MPAEAEKVPEPIDRGALQTVAAIQGADDEAAARLEAEAVEQTDKAAADDEEAASALLDQTPTPPPV